MTENPFRAPESQLDDRKELPFGDTKKPRFLWLICVSVFLTVASFHKLLESIDDPEIKRLGLILETAAIFGLAFGIPTLHRVVLNMARVFFATAAAVGLYQVCVGLINGKLLPATLVMGIVLPLWVLYYISTQHFIRKAVNYRLHKEHELKRQSAIKALRRN